MLTLALQSPDPGAPSPSAARGSRSPGFFQPHSMQLVLPPFSGPLKGKIVSSFQKINLLKRDYDVMIAGLYTRTICILSSDSSAHILFPFFSFGSSLFIGLLFVL